MVPHDSRTKSLTDVDDSGGREEGEDAAAAPPLPGVLVRPCEVYTIDHGDIRLIQTSLGEPSAHWSEVVCVPRRRTFSTSDDDLGRSYGKPSAIIHVDFGTHAFPSEDGRPPILGFGGAFTEASALNFGTLSKDGQEAALDLLFGTHGLGYTLGRTHINSCDFSVKSYSFDDTEEDFNLDDFDTDVTHDLMVGMIDMMLLATKKVKSSFPNESVEYGMRIMASPWSPPSWMKSPTNTDVQGAVHAENMTGSAGPVCIREGVGTQSKYAKSWALFFRKFIVAYANHGIDLYAVSVQNEPEFPAPWEGCLYDPASEGDFIANHLGPTLAESHPNIKILMFDHNKDHMVKWAQLLLSSDHPASKYIAGTAYHWYAGGMDRLLDGALGQPNMHRMMSTLLEDGRNVHRDDGHVLLNSEACHCPTTGYAGGDLTIAWARATRNAHTILTDLAAGSNGFIEWNLILDSIGGPNHLGNLCDAPLLAVPHRVVGSKGTIPDHLDFELAGHPFGRVVGDGKTREELHAEGSPATYLDLGIVVQPMFYYMGHISRFVRPGSWAVPALTDSSIGGATSRTFRPTEIDVPGGGMNDLARVGMEATLWPCEGSTRQEWFLNDANQLQVFGHDWLGAPTTSCLGSFPNGDLGGLLLTTCNTTEGFPGKYNVVPLPDQHKVHIVLKNKKLDTKMSCLVVQPLRNNGGAYGPRGGAQINIGSCEVPWAEWDHDPSMGEISTTIFGDEVCLTTGWPFLQVGAFDTSATGKAAKVAVILNESGESANYVFKNKGKTVVAASIPPHSIQTLIIDS